jgi:putative DNA primase/helicase
MTDRRMERAALALADAGYFVFPCKPRAKEPLTKNGWKDATRDEGQILRWWDRWPDANIGVACGPSGIAVLDIDAKAGADPREVIAGLGLDGYPTVWTGEAGAPDADNPNSLEGVRGAHVYFRSDLSTCKTTVPGVEIRGGGGYVLAPPSVHPSGVPYETAD